MLESEEVGMEQDDRTFGRSTGTGIFLQVAHENYARFREAQAKVREARDRQSGATSEDESSWILYQARHDDNATWSSGTVVIIFAACALEAQIYDYAARRFSDSFVQ